MPVVYSTGNFISSQPWTAHRASGMFIFELVENAEKKLSVRDIKMLPLWMSRTSILTVKPILDINNSSDEVKSIWRQTMPEYMHIKTSEATLGQCFEQK